jgi:branched-chain amino acid transport system substrate-binding protein
MKNFIKCLVVVSMILALSSSVWAERPIRILLLDSLSGPTKDLGDKYLLGTQFAVEEINAEGGLLGQKIEVIAEDHQMKPDVAIRKAQKYLLEGSVDIMTTGTGSQNAKALADLAKQNNVLFANYTMSDEATGKDFTYNSVRLIYSTSMIARALVYYTDKNRQFKKFYLINQDYSYGRDFAAAAKREIAKQIPGAQIVGEDYHPLFIKDFSPFLTKIKASGADCILTANWGTDCGILLKQRHELGVKAVLVNNALSNPDQIREAPEAALGNIACDAYLVTVDTKESADFVSRWRKRYQGTKYPEPDQDSGKFYIGTKFLLAGIKKAQSAQVDKLIPALEGLHQQTLNGEAYLRACDHQLIAPHPATTIISTTYPYFGVPTMIPAAAVAIDEAEIDNPRCKKK